MTSWGSWVIGRAVVRCDVSDVGGWAGVLDEDGALEVGDEDPVAVLDDEDSLARWRLTMEVTLRRRMEPFLRRRMEPFLRSRITRVTSGRSTGRGVCSPWGSRPGRGRSGLGRGTSAFGVSSQAVSGVTLPASPWWGRSVL